MSQTSTDGTTNPTPDGNPNLVGEKHRMTAEEAQSRLDAMSALVKLSYLHAVCGFNPNDTVIHDYVIIAHVHPVEDGKAGECDGAMKLVHNLEDDGDVAQMIANAAVRMLIAAVMDDDDSGVEDAPNTGQYL